MNRYKYQTRKVDASILYYALAFFLFFSTLLSYHIKMDFQYLQAQKHLSTVDKRLSLEGEIFHKVRLGKNAYSCADYSYEVKQDRLYVQYNFAIPILVEYDIIEDESFVWRRNYDYIK